MRIATRTPLGMSALGRPRLGHLALGAVACGVAAATYAIAGRVAAEPQVRGAAPAGVAKPLKPALPVHEASPAAGTAGSVSAAAPSAAEFADDLIGVVNRYAQAHGDPVRLTQAHCVRPSPGHYLCAYGTTKPGSPGQCHVMAALWTPRKASTFTVTLAGRSLRCGSLREALRSLK